MRPLFWITTLALLGVAFGASARQHTDTTPTTHYRWVDATGLPHYSDSLSVKALKFGYDVLGPHGRVVRHVARTSAPDTLQAPPTQQQTGIDQRQHDRQLLMAYPTEAAFKAAQQAHVEQIRQHMHTTRLNLDSQERSLAQLLSNAADFSRQGKTVPHALTQRIAKRNHAVDVQRQLLRHQQTQLTATKKEVAANMAHYRDLLTGQKARYGH